MIQYAETEARMEFDITQGSYNRGGVSASAGTHDGGGAVDISVKGLSMPQIRMILRALKDTGFAAWYRPTREGVWNEHIHAIAIGCVDLSPLAKRQVTAFDAKRDGLVSNNKDLSYRPKPAVIFDALKRKPVPRVKTRAAKVKHVINVIKKG